MLNRKFLLEHINKEYNGNLSAFAKKINISPSTITRLLNGERDAGKKTINALSVYAYKKKIRLSRFIFFNKRVDKSKH